MEKLNIVLIQGTVRQARESIKAAKYIFKILKSYSEVEGVFVDPAELNLPFDGNDSISKDPRYTEITAKADGFIIVTPEYNHSFPGSLKRVLDSELSNYKYKPVAFAGVSSGMIGGARAIEGLQPVVRSLELLPIKTDVYFPRIKEMFNEDGSIKDSAQDERVHKMIKELLWLTKTLKYGRENIL